MSNGVPTDHQVVEMTRKVLHARMENWLATDVFTWKWFLLITIALLPWIVFVKLVDKKKLDELILYGALLIIFIVLMNGVGYELFLWTYPIKILPYLSHVMAIDHAALPVIYMLEYQYFTTWKSFSIAALVTSFIFSFICEPLLVMFDMYRMLAWEHAYSFPIYFVMATSIRWLVIKIFATARRYGGTYT